MPDYLSHVFEGMQAGAALGHMIRQSQQAHEDAQLRQLTEDRRFQLQQQTMAENDIKNRMSLAQNATPVNNGVVQQMLGSISGQQGQATPASPMALGGGGPQPDQQAGAPPDPAELSASPLLQGMAPQLSQGTAAATGGTPAIGQAPVLTKADASRTVKDSTGQQWQLMTPEEQAQRHLGSLKATKEMEAEVEAQKKLEELRNASSNEMKLPASPLHDKYLGIPSGTMIPISKHAALDAAVARIQNAQSLEDSRGAKQDLDPVVGHTVQEGKDGGSVMVLTHKSGATEVRPLAGVKAPGTAAARKSAEVTGRQQNHDERMAEREQGKSQGKTADDVLERDNSIQALDHSVSGMNGALAADNGSKVSYVDEKGKWQTGFMSDDLRTELTQRAAMAAATRDQYKQQRDIKAKQIGWGTTAPSAPYAPPPKKEAPPSLWQKVTGQGGAAAPAQSPPPVGATPKIGEVVQFNGKKGRWTGTKFEPVGN